MEEPEYIRMLKPAKYRVQDGVEMKSTDLVSFPVSGSEGGGRAKRFVASGDSGGGGEEVDFQGLAFTAPFKLLSDEGVRDLKNVILDNEQVRGGGGGDEHGAERTTECTLHIPILNPSTPP